MAVSRVEGIPNVQRKLRRVAPAVRQKVADVVLKTARQILRDMQARVPVSKAPGRHGHLRDALSMQIARGQLSARVGLLSPARRRRFFYWKFLEFGTIRLPARPFIEPALLRAEAAFGRQMQAAVRAALAQARGVG